MFKTTQYFYKRARDRLEQIKQDHPETYERVAGKIPIVTAGIVVGVCYPSLVIPAVAITVPVSIAKQYWLNKDASREEVVRRAGLAAAIATVILWVVRE